MKRWKVLLWGEGIFTIFICILLLVGGVTTESQSRFGRPSQYQAMILLCGFITFVVLLIWTIVVYIVKQRETNLQMEHG
jgi:amino acid transporter